ncbi:MAG: glycosyltransferase [Saprospiraceae bacterium]
MAGPVIILAVLDWGLGHATRSLVVAATLRRLGARVVWAAAGPAADFLRQAAPDDEHHPLPAYAVRYAGRNMYVNLAGQLPRLARAVYREGQVLTGLAERVNAAAVISDSRFGARVAGLPSVFITHQLEPILHPLVGRPGPSAAYRFLLNRFDQIWVPDHPGPDNLSGQLSNPARYPAGKVSFIGPLSRFAGFGLPADNRTPYTIVVLLSGPEPQRTYLERELIAGLTNFPGRHLLIRGKPEAGGSRRRAGNLEIIDLLVGEELARVLAAAGRVICRSGYSSLMDLAAVGGAAVLIPTPGQTEQIYLAERAAAHGWADSATSGSAAVAVVSAQPSNRHFPHPSDTDNSLDRQIKTWLASI